ncbi:MAG: preprotein translocase subunit SecY, partial [Ruthenibacterium sp.]
VVAISPIILSRITGMNISLGGTSLLIVVGVALDTSRSLESYMLMRHHKGFLE